MQMNLPMTAFISQGWTSASPSNSESAGGIPRWTLRWFTTISEGELCGHATLASAHVIFNLLDKKELKEPKSRDGDGDSIIFETKYKGNLEAVMDWSTGHIALNFPSNPPAPLANTGLWLDRVIQ